MNIEHFDICQPMTFFFFFFFFFFAAALFELSFKLRSFKLDLHRKVEILCACQ